MRWRQDHLKVSGETNLQNFFISHCLRKLYNHKLFSIKHWWISCKMQSLNKVFSKTLCYKIINGFSYHLSPVSEFIPKFLPKTKRYLSTWNTEISSNQATLSQKRSCKNNFKKVIYIFLLIQKVYKLQRE